jgi:hypothetical protein
MDKNEFLKQQLDLLKSKKKNSDIEWQDVADFRLDYYKELEHRDTVRKGSKIIYEYIDAGWEIKPPSSTIIDFGSTSEKLSIQKERYKLQTEKLELNKYLRELSRDELIVEKVIDVINNLEPLRIPEYIEPRQNNKSYLLAFGDSHYGIEFEIKDLFGNTINEYSPEIFEQRMWELMGDVIQIVNKEGITELNIWELGDGIQGILRLNSQLMKLKYGIIESSIKYANFLATWLNELSEYVRIKFQMVVDSNHNQIRVCGAPKNAFSEENMSKVMLALIRERVKDNPNIVIIDNPTGMNFGIFSTYSVLGIHGEVKNLDTSLNEFSRAYQTHLDYIIGAHKHHSNSNEAGIDAEAISIRSIIGVDPYGMSLNKTSNPGASLFEFEQGKGLNCEHKIKLG